MPCIELSPEHQHTLLALARKAITCGTQERKAITIDCRHYPEQLIQKASSFVTLYLNQQLRGCIGALEATMPLVQDVAEHAFAAANRDPRFEPVSQDEIPQLQISISVLSAPSALESPSEATLLDQIQAGRDGLILEERDARGQLKHKATYLPSVWQQLPDKKAFLVSLKQKAGLPSHYWSDQLRFSRYQTLTFGE